MSIIRFTQNHDDLSTDRGFQFKFYCDRCRNGYLSSFQTSMTGMASGLLNAAGNLFGGVFHSAGSSAYELQRTVGGQAHDSALRTAVEEVKQQFRQCNRCGKWVCPEVCWNPKRGLCLECAPNLEQEMAAAQAQATKDQVWQKAAEVDFTKKLDLTQDVTASCPECGAQIAVKNPEKGEIVVCPDCGLELEVRSVNPVELAPAPQEEEDWGE